MVQMAGVLLNRQSTLEKMQAYAQEAASQGAELCIFGEAILPGYPFWLENTNAATFNSKVQKEIHARYVQEAIQPESGDLKILQDIAARHKMAIVTGSIEKALNRGGHSLYCSMIYIDQQGSIKNVHRKLMPTYEERLSWATGDGHGLQTFPVGPFTMGGLNCWENWMPLARTALMAQGENLHLAIWPGNVRNTEILNPFLAQEGRSYVISVCGVFHKTHIPDNFPHADLFKEQAPDIMANGGSCISAPDGSWVIPPIKNKEGVFTATLDYNRVLEERQNFDATGHYSRPDVFDLKINRSRQIGFTFED